MPALHKTIVLRIKRSIESHGVLGTLRLSIRAPLRFLHERREAQMLYSRRGPDAFDVEHNVETSVRVHQSDLRVDSPNWTYGSGYWPASVEIVREAIAALPIRHEDFTFIDLGCGKGRVLLVASDYPFARIIGVEFAPELHQIALRNIAGYRSEARRCARIEVVCQDMTTFELPPGPLVLFFYNPASEVVMRNVAARIIARSAPQEIWIIYLTNSYDVFGDFQKEKVTNKYAIYSQSPLPREVLASCKPR